MFEYKIEECTFSECTIRGKIKFLLFLVALSPVGNMTRKSTTDSTRVDVFAKQDIKTCCVKYNTSNEYTNPSLSESRGGEIFR